jgi:thioredoxin 1
MKIINSEEFKNAINENCIVAFSTSWCGPCLMLAPILETITEVAVYKVDTDAEPQLCIEYGIRSVPTIISFKETKEHKRLMGNQTKSKILEMLDYELPNN